MFTRRLQIVQNKISAACSKAGRSPQDPVELIAVSKSHPPAALQEAFAAGIRVFGENKVQEARAKIPELPGSCRWHFLGHLQRNKIRQALLIFDMFHGVDSLAIAKDWGFSRAFFWRPTLQVRQRSSASLQRNWRRIFWKLFNFRGYK